MNNCHGADEGKVMLGRLPTELKYYTASDLIRVGKDYDGGYLISRSDFDETEVVRVLIWRENSFPLEFFWILFQY